MWQKITSTPFTYYYLLAKKIVKAWKHSTIHLHMGPNVLHYFPTQHVSALKCTINILQLTMAALVVTINKNWQISRQKLLSEQIITGSHAMQKLVLLNSLSAPKSRLCLNFVPWSTTKKSFLLHLPTCSFHPDSFSLESLSSFSWDLKMQ